MNHNPPSKLFTSGTNLLRLLSEETRELNMIPGGWVGVARRDESLALQLIQFPTPLTHQEAYLLSITPTATPSEHLHPQDVRAQRHNNEYFLSRPATLKQRQAFNARIKQTATILYQPHAEIMQLRKQITLPKKAPSNIYELTAHLYHNLKEY